MGRIWRLLEIVGGRSVYRSDIEIVIKKQEKMKLIIKKERIKQWCIKRNRLNNVNKNDESFELYVIPEDSKAKVQIADNKEVVGTSSATIKKDSDVIEVTIKVTAQDGTSEIYTLVVSNKSDDCSLAVLKVDDVIIDANETDGKYYVNKKQLTESISVEAIANNNKAKVSINTTTPTLESQKSTVTIPEQVNYINITVTAEDGTSKEYTLVVNKVSNDTELKAYIVNSDEILEEITFNEENKAVV